MDINICIGHSISRAQVTMVTNWARRAAGVGNFVIAEDGRSRRPPALRYQKALVDVLRVRRKRARFFERPALTPLGIFIGLLIIFT